MASDALNYIWHSIKKDEECLENIPFVLFMKKKQHTCCVISEYVIENDQMVHELAML